MTPVRYLVAGAALLALGLGYCLTTADARPAADDKATALMTKELVGEQGGSAGQHLLLELIDLQAGNVAAFFHGLGQAEVLLQFLNAVFVHLHLGRLEQPLDHRPVRGTFLTQVIVDLRRALLELLLVRNFRVQESERVAFQPKL